MESTSCRHCKPFFLFTSLTLQRCKIWNQPRVNIVNLSFCLHRSHHWHCSVVRYRINIMSTFGTFLLAYIVHIVNIAMLYDIDSTSCRHCKPFFLFTSFTSLTLQCCKIWNQHRVNIVILSFCLHHSHRWHCSVVRYGINIVSTL
jgi:hypothetical protein